VGRDASDGTAGLSSIVLFNGLVTHSPPEVVCSQARLLASGDVRAEERSGGSESSLHPLPFRLWGRPFRLGIYDERDDPCPVIDPCVT